MLKDTELETQVDLLNDTQLDTHVTPQIDRFQIIGIGGCLML